MSQNRNVKKRSCDACRRKKIRCDGPDMPDKYCSNCRSYNVECKYEESAKKRGPPKSYVESLEARLGKAESLLRRLVPDGDFTRELGVEVDPATWTVHRTDALAPSSMVSGLADLPVTDDKTPREFITRILRNTNSDLEAPDDDEHIMTPNVTQLSDNLGNMNIDPGEYRFFGKSSGAMLVQTALNMKTEFTGQTSDALLKLKQGSLDDKCAPTLPNLRKEFWRIHSWERDPDVVSHPPPQYQFPEPDLMESLIDLYFVKMNIFWPLLHRPTFEAQWRSGLHTKNPHFSATLLLAVAVGARFSDDPRVFIDDDRGHSAGWKYFNQVSVVRRSLIQPPGLYDLQFHALSTIFLLSSSAPQAGWALAGIGIRFAQDIGAHRKRKRVSNTPTADEELMKRVFWVLVSLDRILSSGLGRPAAIQEEDFDIDYLVECDDEFWDHPDPAQAWKQPEGRPCTIAAFNSALRLNRVLAQVHRTIYSINKQKVAMNLINEDWEEWVVTELDSLLNRWVDTIPSHLQWDPHQQNIVWLQQSAWLHTSYYNLQILVHRPFLSSSKAPKQLVWSSFAICTNAARSSARILDCMVKRVQVPSSFLQIHAFTSAIVLLLAIWGGKKAGLTTNPKTEMSNVLMCMNYLKGQESRWHTAGKLWDILSELACVGDIPLPSSDAQRKKRAREEAHGGVGHYPESSTDSVDAYPHYPSSKRIASSSYSNTPSYVTNSPSGSSSNSAPTPPGTEPQPLPMYTTELGQLPSDPMELFTHYKGQPSFVPQQQHGQYMHAQPPPLQQADPTLPYGKTGASFQNTFQFGPQRGAQQNILTTPLDQSGAATPDSQSFPSAHPFLDNTANLFANVPAGFGQLEDWGPYLTNFGDFGNMNVDGGQQGAGGGGPSGSLF